MKRRSLGQGWGDIGRRMYARMQEAGVVVDGVGVEQDSAEEVVQREIITVKVGDRKTLASTAKEGVVDVGWGWCKSNGVLGKELEDLCSRAVRGREGGGSGEPLFGWPVKAYGVRWMASPVVGRETEAGGDGAERTVDGPSRRVAGARP